jgi:hypothetical protein
MIARRYYLPPGTRFDKAFEESFCEPPSEGRDKWRLHQVRDEGFNVITVYWRPDWS